MGDLESLCSLMFQLSSEDRLRIMLKLAEEPFRLTKLASELGVSAQEAHRHVSRLLEAGLVTKDLSGSLRLTPYGRHVLTLLSGLRFLSDHSDYFADHTLSSIPEEFVLRIGELEGSEFTRDVMLAFRAAELTVETAERFIWIMSNQILVSTLDYLEEAVARGVEFRVILPEDVRPPPGFRPIPKELGRVERRSLSKVGVVLVVSEKSGQVAFPRVDGSFDYAGFRTTSPSGLKWCSDLFSHYWRTAKPLRV